MQTNELFVERRKHTRFQLRPGAYAVLSPNLIKLGQIMDISVSGLAFRYIRYGNKEIDNFDNDVLLYGKNMYVDRIPFQVVSDVELDNPGVFSSVLMNKFSIEFKNLTSKQLEQLEMFIKSHAIN
ncbi:MAG: PilZ domain-containing protein [Proteobacteria bacterium]|nr:PilZ domain-containing protein [Pseudomonadota bacterium]